MLGAVIGVIVGASLATGVVLALARARRHLALEQQRTALGAELSQVSERAQTAHQALGEERHRSAALAAERQGLQERVTELSAELAGLRAALDAERRQAGDKLKTLEEAEARLRDQFKLLAGEVLERSSGKLQGQHHERLEQLLTPLRERLQRFEQQVSKAYDQEVRDRHALRGELKQLYELNQQMSREATNLTRALKGHSKTRGDWGEMILSSLLERSGLREGREYRVQTSYTGEHGERLRPDVVVQLPEGRALVVDSKVQLAAWSAYSEAEDDDTRASAAKALTTAIRSHARDLGSKRYQDLPGIESPDFVLLFVPIEPAFACACQHDPALFQDAFDQHVVIVSPTTLLATLRTVANIWRYEHQNRHALEIAERAGKLYDKFVGFVADLDQVGERLGQAQRAYDGAVNKLSTGRGNLVRQAEQVRQLGAKAAKRLEARWLDDGSDEVDDAEDEDSGATPPG